MEVLALLGVLALSPELAVPHRAMCDLSPSLGAGQSSEGRIDESAALSLGCAYRLYDNGTWSIWPKLSLSEQRWTLYRGVGTGNTSTLQKFQSRDLGLGLLASYSVANWDFYLGLHAHGGQGSLERTDSQATSRQTGTFKDISHRSVQQEFGVQRQVNQQLAFTAALQRSAGRQTWDAAAGEFEGENVDAQSRLTLTSTPTGAPWADRLTYTSWELKLGLSLLLR